MTLAQQRKQELERLLDNLQEFVEFFNDIKAEHDLSLFREQLTSELTPRIIQLSERTKPHAT